MPLSLSEKSSHPDNSAHKEYGMKAFSPEHGLGTLVMHYTEGDNPLNAHVTPIYQTSTFSFPDVETARAIYAGEQPGYTYTRTAHPNADQFATKVALLEALDLLRARPGARLEEVAAGKAFASGMAAISAALLARVRAGETILVQQSLYSNAYNFLSHTAPRLGIEVVFVQDVNEAEWEAALHAHPNTVLIYIETPANPSMLVVDIAMVAEVAHRHGCWLAVDNTFATPYCQRPLALGADIVVHSTTKYLSGLGVIVGGAVVSTRLDYMEQDLNWMMKTVGGAPSPFDAWLANLGLKTFELRMQRHCENALGAARYLKEHSKVAAVYYPGLEDDPGHEVARQQMDAFGGMLSFEVKGGLPAGERLMDRLRLITRAVSLGNVDSLIQHPGSMTHSTVPREERYKMGIRDGLVRFSVGAENLADILSDLEQALEE
jgi:methionine-gamma-lyase